MVSSRKSTALVMARMGVVAAVAVGTYLITQRMIGLMAATCNAVCSVASSASSAPSASIVPALPGDAQVARLEMMADRINIMADNLANAETIAFKRQRAEVNAGPETKAAELQLDMTQGSLQNTGGITDLAIQGDGFFHIKISSNVADGTGYTRNGSLMRNRDGDLVVTIGPGYELIPPINIPMAATNISIACDGKLQFTNAAGKAVTCGQIKLCRFMNPQGLRQLGGGIYTQTVISGPPVVNNPGDNGVGQVMQGFLESSNVDPIKEWAGMLKAEQSLQLNSQAMRTLDRARVALVNLKKS